MWLLKIIDPDLTFLIHAANENNLKHFINDNGDLTNRGPNKHRLVTDAISRGDCVSVITPGSFTNVFIRSGHGRV